MWEKLLKLASGINNLKSVFYGRLLIGLIFIFYGFAVFYFSPIKDIWIKWSILLAFLGIGATFVLDGQSILREYFTNNQKTKIINSQDSFTGLLKLFFVIGSLLFFVKFYTLENPSLYPIAMLLIAIILILVFHKKISHFEISKNKVLIKMKEDKEKDYDNLQLKKKNWNFEIKEKNKNDL